MQPTGRGLKFGIWVDWTQAALNTEPGALNCAIQKCAIGWSLIYRKIGSRSRSKDRPSTSEFPKPSAWAHDVRLNRLVTTTIWTCWSTMAISWRRVAIATDHPHAPPDRAHQVRWSRPAECYSVNSSNSTDVSYHAVRAYYDIYSNLRKDHPDVLLEICNDGGRMVDFGSAAHGDYFSITDTYDPLSNRRAFLRYQSCAAGSHAGSLCGKVAHASH